MTHAGSWWGRMIIRYNESKATAEQAPRYAKVLSTYVDDGRREQHELLL